MPEKINSYENENFPFARLKVYRGTCYGSPALTVEMIFSATDEMTVEFSEGMTKKRVSLDRAEAESFFSKIIEMIDKPEVLSGWRHVEVCYHAEVEWGNLSFVEGSREGKFKDVSNEWLTKELEYFMPKLEDANPKSAEDLRIVLKKGLHRRAIEIYLETKKFGEKHFPAG